MYNCFACVDYVDVQDIADVIAATETLKTAQAAEDSPEARATLPALSISDLDTKIKTIPIDVTEVSW
jgi:Zn-dependent M16 (insulinase) family peptidase